MFDRESRRTEMKPQKNWLPLDSTFQWTEVCEKCRARTKLIRDHIVPTSVMLARGRDPNVVSNIQWLCGTCNEEKTVRDRQNPEYRTVFSPLHSAEAKEKIRQSMLGREISEEWREKLRQAAQKPAGEKIGRKST
jgi:5-methylcytosine-specific restriction endonuclease McrA